jgi:brefeldin A-inhibited guanine nucleotide-exchange protein
MRVRVQLTSTKLIEHRCMSVRRAETCYMLAFATLMLNTDAHNPQVRDKMSKTAFIANNR